MWSGDVIKINLGRLNNVRPHLGRALVELSPSTNDTIRLCWTASDKLRLYVTFEFFGINLLRIEYTSTAVVADAIFFGVPE